jgi:acyl carrier protein
MDVYQRIQEASGIAAESSTRIDDLGLDSLELLELFHELNISHSAIFDLATVGEIVDYVAARTAQ